MCFLHKLTALFFIVFCHHFLLISSYPYENYDEKSPSFLPMKEGYAKIKAGVLNRKRSLDNTDLIKGFEVFDSFFNKMKENPVNKNMPRFRREDIPSIEKCCEVIKEYIEKKNDARDVLCSESDLEQCCNDFADEIKKQEDAYNELCKNNSTEHIFPTVGCTKTTDGDCCAFPFTYVNNVTYRECININTGGKYWCSLTNNYVEDKKWGFCQMS